MKNQTFFISKTPNVISHQGEYEFDHLEIGDDTVTVWRPYTICHSSYFYGGNCNCCTHEPVTWERQTLPRKDFDFNPSEWEEVGEDRFCPPYTEDREEEEWQTIWKDNS